MYENDPLDEIIEEKLSRSEILKLRAAGEIREVEFLLLFSLDNRHYFRRILIGSGEYHIPFDSTVPADACFTNVPAVMDAMYSLYGRFPLYHFDRLFACILESMLATRFELFYVLYLLHYHLKCEEKGEAAFTIDAAPLLEKAAVYLQDEKFRNICRKNRSYDARGYEDGELGLFRDYNKLFLRRAGVSILPEEECAATPGAVKTGKRAVTLRSRSKDSESPGRQEKVV